MKFIYDLIVRIRLWWFYNVAFPCGMRRLNRSMNRAKKQIGQALTPSIKDCIEACNEFALSVGVLYGNGKHPPQGILHSDEVIEKEG